MVSDDLLRGIRAAIRENEIGKASPYRLDFARKGKSGASFGVMQGDMNVDPLPRATLEQVLRAAGTDDVTVGRIMTALGGPCPNGNPLSPADGNLVDAALSSPAGRPIVDAMDAKLLKTDLARTDQAIAAAAARGWNVAPPATLCIALWVNMTGAPTLLCKWIAGQTVLGIAPPKSGPLTRGDMENYLARTSYFQLYPKNLDHFRQSVDAGVAALAPAGAQPGG
jgi:hypothetical protein